MHSSIFNSEAAAIRRFALHAGSFLALQAGIALLISWTFLRQAPETYMAALNDKQHRLENSPAPRLILAGSSNMALSFDSTTVMARLGLDPVNMGMHQGLGLEFFLNDISRHVNKGDVVLVSLEYAHYRADLTTDIILEAMIAAPHATWEGSEYKLLQKLPDQVLALLGRRTRTLALAGLGKGKLVPEPPYRRDSFNEWGDNSAHRSMQPLPGREKGIPFHYSETRVDTVVNRINQFAQTCRDHGATLYYSHPPYPQFEFDRDRQQLEKLHKTLTQRLTFPLISDPVETVYPDDGFYDTEYHTLERDTQLRTALVLDRLTQRRRAN